MLDHGIWNDDSDLQRRRLFRSRLLCRRPPALGVLVPEAAWTGTRCRLLPRDAGAADVSVGIYRFRDETALHAALASAEIETVMADVSRFTDATVSRLIGDPL
jgi:hypothetical protein